MALFTMSNLVTWLVMISAGLVMSRMVMDESSCEEVEEQECGLCHTVYMEECAMEMVEEMRPAMVKSCKNVTKYEEKCKTVMEDQEIEEKKPVCKVKMMNKDHKACVLEKDKKACKRVMKCQLITKMVKKKMPNTKCEKVAMAEKEEKCFDMVKLKKEKHEKKSCSFHPKTVCHDSEGRECRTVKKKMCNYIDSNQL